MAFNNFAISAVTGNDHMIHRRTMEKSDKKQKNISRIMLEEIKKERKVFIQEYLKKHRKNQLKNALKSKKCGHIKTFDYTKTLSFLIKD